jgi:PKD repeat protein
MLKKIAAVMMLLTMGVNVNAQEVKYCGATEMWNEAVKNDPAAAQRRASIADFKERYKQFAERTATGSIVFTIPIVFHVIHEYGSENISKAQIEDAVRLLNLSYQKLNPDTVNVIPLFQPIFANCQIQFRLANIDPQGNCTDGITRTYSLLTRSAGDNVKSLSQWNSANYLNIWVVKNIASGAAGYAYYPGISAGIDGIVILHDYVGGIGTSPGSNYNERALTHEVGHWLDLPHTWGSSNTPGLASNCNIDDGISDTPNTIGVMGGCNTSMNSCGDIANVQNYMDYAACPKMFTEGQKDRMHLTLYSSVSSRDNLSAPANLLATGTEDGRVINACAPRADFDSKIYNICSGSTVNFKDVSWRGDVVSRQWIFAGGTPAADTSANPTVTYANPGKFDVTLIVTSANGTDTLTRSEVVNVISAVSSNQAPYSEGFENLVIANSDWQIENPNLNNTWTINNLAAATGSYSIRLQNNSGSTDGSVDALISPSFSTLGQSGISLSFKMAFAPKVTSDSSIFRVYVSTNCGRTWVLRYNKASTNIHTATPNFAGNWAPTLASQWSTQTIALTPYGNQSNVRLKFEFTNDKGNNLYLDDINITAAVGINDINSSQYNLQVYPNPASQNLNIALEPQRNADITIELTDLAGRSVYSYDAGKVAAGEFHHAIENKGFNGMYILRVRAGEDSMQKPVIFGN